MDYFLTLWVISPVSSSATVHSCSPLRLFFDWLSSALSQSRFPVFRLFGSSTLRMAQLVWTSLLDANGKLRQALRSAAGQVDGIGVIN